MRKQTLLLLAAALVGGALTGGLALATTGPSSNVIHACYKQQNGQLRRVETPTDCDPSEAPINWNVKGDKGDPGALGLPGQPGIDGTSVTSSAEPAGANCAGGGSAFTSASGTTYACNGAKGDKGEKGEVGETGEAGAPGISGYESIRVDSPLFSGPDLHTGFASCPAGKAILGAVSSVLGGDFGAGEVKVVVARQERNDDEWYWESAVIPGSGPAVGLWLVRTSLTCASVAN